MTKLSDHHTLLKATRHRGSETAPHVAAVVLLRRLEEELDLVRQALNEAWRHVDERDSRKCLRHMDHAQQRLHRVIRKLERRRK